MVFDKSSQTDRNGAANGKVDSRTSTVKSTKSALDYSNVHNANALSAGVDFLSHKDGIDDRKLALEFGLSFLSKHPNGEISQNMQDKVIELLYNDLPHPPATNLGEKFAWRTADGSGNNIADPELGKAGGTYSRSVQQTHLRPQRELPDAGLLFDTLLKREGFVKHPAGLSSLMFSFAAFVIHTVFRTRHEDYNINDTSSYVDLAPLYGSNQEEQNKIRNRSDGRGHLYPDVFAEDRLLLLPPAVCVLLVLFSRNHNYIAKKLFDINERGTYKDPSQLSKEQANAQDEELFQTARLINIGWFGTVVFSDYLSCILGLVRQGSNWSLNPFGEIRKEDHSFFERGRGNSVSVEFNCLYRWHATTSEHDEQWVSQMTSQLFNGKEPETIADFKALAVKFKEMTTDLHAWTFGGLKRQENGYFKDEDLANLLKNATDQPAGAFRARGTPANMRLHEIMGIEQSRKWGVCTLNDFRKYLGLKTYSSFREWNPDPEIADAAEKLYGDINNLELYVGLQAEESKPVVEGAGLCPGYTISRAILSDAIALTRGDRFFTQDYTPYNLTTWGFADCQRDPNAFGFGSTLGRLFLRTLPNQFEENSTYAFFPLMTPDAMGTHLKKLNVADKYQLSKSPALFPFVSTGDYAQVGHILNSSDFSTQYQGRVARVIDGKGFFANGQNPQRESQIIEALSKPDSESEILEFFYRRTRQVIESESFHLSGAPNSKAVDIVRDVLRAIPIHWAADVGGIPLTTKSFEGEFTAKELFEMLGDIYSFIYLDIEHSKIMVLQEKVKTHVEKLSHYIEIGMATGLRRLSMAGVIDTISTLFSKSKKTQQHEVVKRLQQIGISSNELTNTVLAIMVGVSVELSVAFTNVVNFYLDSDHHMEIQQNSNKDKMEYYARQAMRSDPPFQGAFRKASKDQVAAGLDIREGTKVFLDIYSARTSTSQDPHKLPHDRMSKCLGETLTMKIIGEVLRAVFELRNLRRAPEQSGRLKRFKDSDQHDLRWAYLDENGFITPWPTSMIVQYDV
ncbi:linoleate diol synthase [Dendrothele bispora CBS 962.96]|uniref:Linoleate diol synthase n=1 Tax=Dendrothele bispora (strain CBS 962.96) TaxID=1314807 RepID=A0A4S8MRB2_DENBC|nr:linoleate diol synthase [Dendrothele bispora CBS 962.96]